jgi:serine/threonine protein kinase
MVDPETSQFWRAAVQSGLIGAAKLRACWEGLPEEKRTPDAVDRRLARQAVNAGFVSVWQAQQLMTGRASGFKIEDRYVLVDLIGQGGMGRVYLAKDTRLGRQVALKVLSTSRMANPRAIARFQREGKVGAQLQHENLVRIYDEGESSNIRYLVMEFIEGKNVAQIINEQGPIPWPAASRLVRQVALGLEHAHLKGLIHRDVNPSNILVTRDGTAKLTDLGLAIDLADESTVTRDGATVGTFDYISPEQAKHSRDVDTRADIYSLGCTLYHMLSGRVPFPTPSLPEKLYAHQLQDAEPLTTINPAIPEGLSKVVQTMMAKRVEDRYTTPLAVAQALEPFVDETARIFSGAVGARPSSVESPSGVPRTKVAAPIRLDHQIPPLPKVVSTIEASDPDLTFFKVDIGPDEPLSASLASANRPKPKPIPTPTPTPTPQGEGEITTPGPPRRSRLLVIGIVVLVLAVAGGVVAVVVVNRIKGKRGAPPAVEVKVKPPVESTDTATGDEPKPKTEPPRTSHGISVVSREGETREAATLAEAVAIALGNGGDVVLNPSGPIRLSTGAEAIRVTRGSVTIRAAEGTTPLLAIDVTGGNPAILTNSGSSLTLRGLKIVAHYQAGVASPALIQAGGTLRLDRCTFVATGAVGRSSLALVEGLKVEVDGCLIAGFHRPIDVDFYPGASVTIRQSILVPTAETASSGGWGVRVRYGGMAATKAPRRISFDHATIAGGGLLEVVGFPTTQPLIVNLDHVAVQTRVLLAWTPLKGDPEKDWSKGLKWTGKGDRYDVTGSPWVLASTDGNRPMPDAPTDLKSWSEALKTDTDAIDRSFKFAAPLPMEIAAIDPEGFTLTGDDLAGVGADPKQVGPARPKADTP